MLFRGQMGSNPKDHSVASDVAATAKMALLGGKPSKGCTKIS